jgi:hypothetical protein
MALLIAYLCRLVAVALSALHPAVVCTYTDRAGVTVVVRPTSNPSDLAHCSAWA